MKNLVILCGGLSSRMGEDKALLKIGETTFVEYIYRNASEYFDRIIISVDNREHADKISELPLFRELSADSDVTLPEIVLDNYDKEGPLGGLLSVFENTDVERFAVISTDVPYADMRILSALFDVCTKGACMLIMDERPPEPLIAAYDRVVHPSLKEFLNGGNRILRMSVPTQYSQLVSEDELRCFDPELRDVNMRKVFKNFNTIEELKELYD